MKIENKFTKDIVDPSNNQQLAARTFKLYGIEEIEDKITDGDYIGYNVTNKNLSSNSTAVEAENDFMDIVYNGFKIRRGDVLNVSGDDYIYWAFAESPFTNSSGVPNNAR